MAEELLLNLLAVARYLQDQGYRIGKSAVYEHARQGKIQAEPEGGYAEARVLDYAKKWLRKVDGAKEPDDTAALQKEKLKAETKRIQANAELATLRSQIMAGDFIARADYEKDLAARALLFKTDLNHFARSRPGEIIELVEGKPDKASDLIDWMLEAFEEFLGRYSRDVDVPVEVS